MDDKLVEEISSSTGVPQELVSRSAQARAEANGVDINSILSSWSSGEVVTATSPEVKEEPIAVEAVAEEPIAVEAVAEEPIAVEAVAEEPIAVEATVQTLEEVEPPVSLLTKIMKSLQYGALFGVVAGFIQALIVSSNLYDGLALEAESLKLIANYERSQYILNLAITTVFFSVVNTINIKKILDTNFDGFGIHTSDRESVFLGIGLGLIFGSSSAFFITSSVGQTIEGILPEDPTTYLIPVFGSFWRVILLGIISQSLITLITMILGVPKGLDVYEQEQADIVRKRITGSLIVPLGAIFSGGVVSVFISQVFINFHDYATLFALIISATVLLFAAVMSSAPKIKITRNEVLIASAGILTLIVIIASVAASQH